MSNLLKNLIIDNHLFISLFLSVIIFILVRSFKTNNLLSLLKILLIYNFTTFYLILNLEGIFNLKSHLPLHLCYLTEIIILISMVLKSNRFYPILILNSFGGGITGFTNLNLDINSHLIEFHHFYLSHFNILFFSIIMYKNRYILNKIELIKAFIINSTIFLVIILFNSFFKTNYWFTHYKPVGKNLTLYLPDWPYYLIILVGIGITSYIVTFKLFSRNNN